MIRQNAALPHLMQALSCPQSVFADDLWHAEWIALTSESLSTTRRMPRWMPGTCTVLQPPARVRSPSAPSGGKSYVLLQDIGGRTKRVSLGLVSTMGAENAAPRMPREKDAPGA